MVHSTWPGPFDDRREAIGHRQSQVIMAVHRDDRLAAVRHMFADPSDELAELLRNRIAHGIRNVDRAGAGADDRLDDFVEIGGVRTARIHRRKFHIVHVAPRPLHHLHGALLGFLAGHPELMLQVDVRRRKKRVDANLGRTLQGFPGPIDVLGARPGETADRRAFDLLRDAPDRLEIPRRAVGEACLDDVDAEPRQLLGHHHFFLHIHAGARGLFPIPQRRIEDPDHPRHRVTPLSS